MATDSTEKKLRAALGRLTAGTAVRTDGRLTVSGLAREAELSRATAHRYPAVLKDLAAASQCPTFVAVSSEGETGLADRNARLAAENTLLRAEKEALANTIYVLTELKVLPMRTGQNNT